MDQVLAIRTLQAVVDCGSFTAAAEQLGLSKSQVSKQVSALEGQLHTRLLRRSTRQLALTAEGELYLHQATSLVDALEELGSKVAGQVNNPSGRLKVSVGVSYGTHCIGPLLAKFSLQYPNIQLDVQLADRTISLLDEGIDAAVRVGKLRDSSHQARQIGQIQLRCCATPAYLRQNPAINQPSDLLQHNCLIYEYAGTPHEWPIGNPQKPQRVRGSFRSNNGEILVQAGLAGRGVIFQPDFLVNARLASGELCEVLTDFERPTLPVSLVYADGAAKAARVRLLADYLQQQLKNDNGIASK